MTPSLTPISPDFSAQFRPRYTWHDDAMLSAWWWTMWWPWVSLGILPPLPTPPAYDIAAIFREPAWGG